MSNIYIQEPATHGKVLLETSVGDIDIELWSKEAPKACRNFVQLCLEGYYDKTIFHRVVPDFIVQGGDPTGTGQGGESIYGKPFKDEFHSRLRFVRRGLVAMANAGPNDNGSQFFFTMGSTPELQNKHTIFGKVTGDTVFNILRLQECEIGANERPLYPHKILKTKVLSNPFDDIVPRWTPKNKNEEEKKVKSKSKATKNFKLLSFGEEAQEDEEETNIVTKDMRGKSKSSHDLANDPRLSSVPALEVDHGKEDNTGQKRKELEGDVSSGEEEQNQEPMEADKEVMMEQVQKKLKKNVENIPSSNKSEDEEKEEPKPKASRRDELREEAEKLKREIRDSKKREKQTTKDIKQEEVKHESTPKNDALAEYQKETQKYKDMRKQQAKKGPEREEMTLSLLAKFQAKLHAAKSLVEEEKAETKDGEEEEEDDGDMSWMRHKLIFEEHNKKVIDANIHDLDRDELRQEDGKLKREISFSKKRKKQTTKNTKEEEVDHVSIAKNDALAEYRKETQKYTELHKVQAKKGLEREEMTMNLLAKFQAKLNAAKSLVGECSYEEKKVETKDGEEEEDDLSWMRHKLTFEEHNRKVIDANIQNLDRYEIYDPRNPLTKRRREASKQIMKDNSSCLFLLENEYNKYM